MAAVKVSISGSSMETELQLGGRGAAFDGAGGRVALDAGGGGGTRAGTIIDLCAVIPRPAPRAWRPKLAAGPNGFILDLNEIPAPTCATAFHSPRMSFGPSVPKTKRG